MEGLKKRISEIVEESNKKFWIETTGKVVEISDDELEIYNRIQNEMLDKIIDEINNSK